jgi:predicted regulator of Ras-like GTPase activity (Roadblock/LC7/MglB family)
MKDMILFPEDIERMNSVLLPLVQKANLLLAVLINKDGRLLTNQGQLETVDIVSLAALIAGNSASTLAIATLVGEKEFDSMYHQGKDKHIYISNVDEDTFMSLVFDDRTNIDRVKVFVRQFDRQLKEALVQVYNKTEDQIDLDLDMNSPAAPSYTPAAAPQQSQANGQVVYMDMNKR